MVESMPLSRLLSMIGDRVDAGEITRFLERAAAPNA
jgi:hypothetical protein